MQGKGGNLFAIAGAATKANAHALELVDRKRSPVDTAKGRGMQ